jgi:hypothetical protein
MSFAIKPHLYRTKISYSLRADNVITNSDIRIKENVKPLSGSLAKIKKLNLVKYDIKKKYYKNSKEEQLDKLIKSGKDNTGFIAQEMKEVYPNLVNFDEDAGLYGINYISLIPELVKAMQEQQTTIENLQKEIAQLKSGEISIKKREMITPEPNNAATSSLSQNRPNPFSESTVIEYSIPNATKQAMICIYDMNGTQLKCYTLDQTGNGSITINGNEINAGMYLYALIVDGQEVDTKRMILTN